MTKIRIGITGQTGFVGSNLYNYLGLFPDKYERVAFKNEWWKDEAALQTFVGQCDVIFHLAALVRSPKENEVYDTNIFLGNQIINALIAKNVHPCLLFASSVQEFDDTEYARCKRETRMQLSNWARQHNSGFAGMILPNLFGPGARPNSHSFIATFCYKLTHNETPQIIEDNSVSLKYIGNLVKEIVDELDDLVEKKSNKSIRFQPDFTIKVSWALAELTYFKEQYLLKGKEPEMRFDFEKDLFSTFKSYIDI